jgi:hypothetical protein
MFVWFLFGRRANVQRTFEPAYAKAWPPTCPLKGPLGLCRPLRGIWNDLAHLLAPKPTGLCPCPWRIHESLLRREEYAFISQLKGLL